MSFGQGSNETAFLAAIGRLVCASFRQPSASFSSFTCQAKPESLEDVLQSMLESNIWQTFSYQQKRCYAFCVLSRCEIQGGESVMFLQLLGPDAVIIATDLARAEDSDLVNRMGMSAEAVRSYRAKLSFLKQPAPAPSGTADASAQEQRK